MTDKQDKALRALIIELAGKHGDSREMFPLVVGISDPQELLAAAIGVMWGDGWSPQKAVNYLHKELGISIDEGYTALLIAGEHFRNIK